MAIIGKRNTLRALRETEHGLYLDGGTDGEILLPKRYLHSGDKVGSELDVFIYRDSEDRLVATTEKPLAMVGDFAALKVVGGHRGIGAFLDWGLSKDLLLPNRELSGMVGIGDSVVVYVHIDPKSNRIVATTKLDGLLNLTPPVYNPGQKVRIIVVGETPLGFKAIVDGSHWGLLYRSEIGTHLMAGTTMDAFVRTVRQDGKIDIGITPAGYGKVTPLTDKILESLAANGGTLPMGDHSSPGEVQAKFGTSKKAFKQAIGALYKKQKIRIVDGGIELAVEKAKPTTAHLPRVVRRRP
jgi:uncharacterized protein